MLNCLLKRRLSLTLLGRHDMVSGSGILCKALCFCVSTLGRSVRGKGTSSSQTSFASTRMYDESEADACAVVWSERLIGDRHSDLVGIEESAILLSCYAWDNFTPQLLHVGGFPPAYIPGSKGMKLAADFGEMLAYEDHFRHPEEPTAPIRVAVEALEPDFNFFNSCDHAMDANTLKKLYGFLRSDCSATWMIVADGLRDPSFKLQVDALGVDGPMIFTRVEQHDRIPTPPNVFGQAFEAALTKPISSERNFYSIVRVQLGQQRLVVRSQVDAWEYPSQGDVSSEVLAEEAKFGIGFFGNSCLKYVLHAADYKGSAVELKTRRAKYRGDIDWEAYYLQMLFSGANKLVLGLHEKGCFEPPQELTLEMVRQKIDSAAMSRSLARLEELLQKITGVVRGSGGSMDLFYAGEGNKPLVMRRRA